ncbi:MAG: porin, partial [Proteobacteria bacterium]|nr:porin [Pseudomonadota bacterium]
MNTFSKLLTVATLLAAVAATKASAELRHETGNGGYMLAYGQFDPAYLSVNDGASTTGKIVDNANSNSRVGFWYRQTTANGEFSINLETALGLRSSGSVSQNGAPNSINWQRTNIRKVEAIWKDNHYGTIYLGQGSMTSDGASGYDLSGTTLVLYNAIPDTAGKFRFRTTTGVLSSKTIGQAFGSFDGGRKARLRYDTPTFGGVRLSASYGEELLN